MQFDTKIAVVIRTDLEVWQKLNVASFLAGGLAAAFPECVGEPYGDGSGTNYLALIGQPILIYGADRPALSRALERALARDVTPAVYTEEHIRIAARGLTVTEHEGGGVNTIEGSILGHEVRRTRHPGQRR